MKLQNGWMAGVARLDSPHFGARPSNMDVDLLVVHSISLPPGEFGTQKVQALFTNQLDWAEHPYFQAIEGIKVSAHFFIDRTGAIWQFVNTNARAWHAGLSCFRGRENCNDFSIGVELEGVDGGLFEPIQYKQLASLSSELRRHYPITHIVGHEHIAPGRKSDPGSGFDWVCLHQSLGWKSRCFPALDL